MYILLVATLVLILDQGSKQWIISHMALYESWSVWPGVFHITYILNPGAAFGILREQQGFFLAIVIGLVAGILYFSKQIRQFSVVGQTGIGLLLGGAFGNAYDRWNQGTVIDFLDIRYWPIFNIADVAITFGVVLLVWYMWREDAGKD